MAAAITTNTAIEFCRKLDDDFEVMFPGQEKRHELGCLYCTYLRISTDGYDRDSAFQSNTCITPAREVLLALTVSLESLKERPGAEMSVPPEFFPLYMERSDCSSIDEDDRPRQQDMDVATGMIPEFLALIEAKSRVRAEHEIFRGLRQLKQTNEQPFWLTFGLQVYLDIRHILEEDVDQGFQDLCREAQLIKKSVNRVLTFHREMGVEGFADETLRKVSDVLTIWTERDQVCVILGQRAHYMPPFYHLERDPLWCGMLLYNFRMVAHEGAILNANSSIFILATAHLYNSLRQAGTLPCEWPDMERIISMHRPGNLFVGDRPTTFANSFKNFNLAIGMSPVMLASNQRKRWSDVLRSSRPRKFLGNLAPTLWKFKPSICDGVTRCSLGPGDAKRFMRQTVLEEAGGQSTRFDSNNGAPFILELLYAVVHLETSEITFDHFEMHIVCWKLLRELHDVLGESLEGWSEVYRSNDRTLPSIVLWLFAELVEEERVGTDLRFGGLLASTDVLARVGEVVAGFIAREGGVAMKGMRGKHAVVLTT
jgi:hypothetical protein